MRDAVRTLEQPTASLADQYRANTGPVDPHVWASFGPRTTLYEPKIVGSLSLKVVHVIVQPRAIRLRTRGSKTIENSYKPAARSSAQSDHGFRYVLNWQTRTQTFFIRTVESNKTELFGFVVHRFTYQSLRIFITIV